MTKILIPNPETGSYEEQDTLNLPSRSKAKDEAYFNFFDNYTKKIQGIEQKLREMEKEEVKTSNRNIEVLAIFVTLFTFISLETQILRSGIPFISAVGFSILMLGGLFTFLFSLRFFIKDQESIFPFWQYLTTLFISIVLMGGSGLSMIYVGQVNFNQSLDDKYYQKSQVDRAIVTGVNNSLNQFKSCIQSSGGYWPCLKQAN